MTLDLRQKQHFNEFGWGWRHVIAFLIFLGANIVYMLRVNLSIALVAMVNQTAVLKETKADAAGNEAYCLKMENSTFSNNESDSDLELEDGEFVWNAQEQALILGSFFYGYIILQFPSGLLEGRFGAKWVLGLPIFLNSLLTLLTPLAARFSFRLLFAVRFIEGLCQAFWFPAVSGMLGKWVPPGERSMIPAFTTSGTIIGTMITFAASGYLASTAVGWSLIFYFFGILGCLWFVLWSIFASSNPASHRWISDKEKLFIIDSIYEENQNSNAQFGIRDVPWRSLLTSLPAWAIFVAHSGHNFGFYLLLTQMPTFLRTIQGYHLETNGLLSALPYLGMFLSTIAAGFIADRMRRVLSTTFTRKFFGSLGQWLGGACILLVGLVGCDRVAVICLLTAGSSFIAVHAVADHANHLDICPQYAGITYGISNTFANLEGFIAPLVVGAFTQGNATIGAWQKVFGIVCAVHVSCGLFYLIFASGELQKWAAPKQHQNDE